MQNEIAPKSFELQNEKFEKRPETSPKSFKLCSAELFHRHFSQFGTRNFKHNVKRNFKLCHYENLQAWPR